RGSELIIVPFNQGSTLDTKSLVEYIFGSPAGGRGLGWDLDFVIPFAGISSVGNDIARIDSRTELAHRIMLTNILRLLGEIKDAKERLGYGAHPSLVVLPLSPNHGTFGGDGMYGESKSGLETILNRWESESWADYLSIAGAAIGWARGTGLMSDNNMVAHEFEKFGVRTFSTREMAFNILGLLHPDICDLAETQPIWADLNGGLQWIPHLGRTVINTRASIRAYASIKKAVSAASASDFTAISGDMMERISSAYMDEPLANHRYPFPAARTYRQLEHLRHLQGMVNLDKVIVITGYGEVGPFGNAENRWEMEAFGEFSLEGCIELAWIMGLIKHHNGPLKSTDTVYTGWVDAKTGDPVKDTEVKPRYEAYILEHTGIRLIEPEMMQGYDPDRKTFIRELQIEHDMEPFEASADEAAAFKHQNGDKVDVWENKNGSWSVRFLKGAIILVPKALRFEGFVSAQLPTGWDPARYGISDEMIRQVDPVTLYTITAAVEALVRSGITDPYELYSYFHVSAIGNTIGSSIGGGRKAQGVFKKRFLDKEVQSDVLQETFINTTAAWINMLLLSSSGPIKPAVGTCGTSVLSIDTAVETIQSGKANVMLAGGFEIFTEESSYEFAQMGATSNSVKEFASGRTPAEMCRPCTSTRNGFMEGEGAGVVTLMSASAAIEFGAPIYGIVAMSGTATDKQGSSVPAPGQGVLTSAREMASVDSEQLLDISYRRRRLDWQLAAIDEWMKKELEGLESGARLGTKEGIIREADRERAEALDTWGNEFWKRNPQISPLRGSLAVWGLTVDDIGVASFHGTSTVANDKNESEVLNRQMEHLGRTPGLAVPAVCQKWLTGHSKGAAAAWMLNGVLQSLRTGIVPGNRNADNIAAELEKFEYIVYPSRSIQTPGIKAGLLKSFGFGQVGGEMLVVHPDYLFAVLTCEQLDEYNKKLLQREAKSYRYWQNTLVGNSPFVQIKSAPPYTVDQEQKVYLNPLARATYDPAARQYKF
ncbi:thiolase-like protein, partial [Martensiomyces pterosporus]